MQDTISIVPHDSFFKEKTVQPYEHKSMFKNISLISAKSKASSNRTKSKMKIIKEFRRK